jgi:hypothetical protein
MRYFKLYSVVFLLTASTLAHSGGVISGRESDYSETEDSDLEECKSNIQEYLTFLDSASRCGVDINRKLYCQLANGIIFIPERDRKRFVKSSKFTLKNEITGYYRLDYCKKGKSGPAIDVDSLIEFGASPTDDGSAN